jgi:hypothetical protein
MCSPEYRQGEKRIIGINQPCSYFMYVAKTECKFINTWYDDMDGKRNNLYYKV